MSEYSAKTLREKMKAKARSLANPGSYSKDQEVSSADWSPAEPLDADVKTGARPVGKGARLYKSGGKVSGSASKARADRKPRATGGRAVEKEIGIGMANKDVRAANEQREGKKHIGAFKKGGRTKKNIGGVLEKISPAYAAMRSIQRGSDEEQQTKDRLQQAAMMNAARGAKKGGKVAKKAGGATSIPTDKETQTNKARIGSEKIKPVRAKAETYKKGGRSGYATDGSVLKRITGAKSEAEKQAESMRDVGKMGTANYTQEDKGALNRALKGDNALPEPGEAAERSGKYQNYKKGGRAGRKTGGRTKGKGKTDIHITINAGKKAGPEMPPLDMGAGMPSAPMMPPPALPPGPGPAAPPPAGLPMGGLPGAPAPGLGGPPGRKAGGRITKIARSYKDMEAGAASGEGRLQKTDIEKRHTDAPTRKTGGRISKIAKSFKDMTAGAGDGEGRLQKMDIAKFKKARSK